MVSMFGLPNYTCSYDEEGFVVCKSIVDCTVHQVVSQSLRELLLNLVHCPRFTGHPGGRNMYDRIRKYLYWSQISNNVDDTFCGW